MGIKSRKEGRDADWGVISIKGVVKQRKRWQRKYIEDGQEDGILGMQGSAHF